MHFTEMRDPALADPVAVSEDAHLPARTLASCASPIASPCARAAATASRDHDTASLAAFLSLQVLIMKVLHRVPKLKAALGLLRLWLCLNLWLKVLQIDGCSIRLAILDGAGVRTLHFSANHTISG